MKRVVLIISDGLWAGDLNEPECAALAPVLESGTIFANHSGVTPSVTRVSAASIMTGCRPAKHGLFGNRVALPHSGGGFDVHDVGLPCFFADVRRITGRVLHVPVIAELLQPDHAFLACSNVSPGAAYMLDPEHVGYVFHREGSFGPGGVPLRGARALRVTKGKEGDRAMTKRFIAEMQRVDPALAVLWLSEPDASLHQEAPGSVFAREGMRCACECIELIREHVEQLRGAGDDVLFLVGSDHGMDPVNRVVGVEDELIYTGFKKDRGDPSLVVAANGGSVLVALCDPTPNRVDAIVRYAKSMPWAGAVYATHGPADGSLSNIGLREDTCLSVFINAAETGERSEISGRSLRWLLEQYGETGRITEKGAHGFSDGLSMHPYLIVNGSGFPQHYVHDEATSLTDMAPTILMHLGIKIPGWMDSESLHKQIIQGV